MGLLYNSFWHEQVFLHSLRDNLGRRSETMLEVEKGMHYETIHLGYDSKKERRPAYLVISFLSFSLIHTMSRICSSVKSS